jgi:hypothetical protein
MVFMNTFEEKESETDPGKMVRTEISSYNWSIPRDKLNNFGGEISKLYPKMLDKVSFKSNNDNETDILPGLVRQNANKPTHSPTEGYSLFDFEKKNCKIYFPSDKTTDEEKIAFLSSNLKVSTFILSVDPTRLVV